MRTDSTAVLIKLEGLTFSNVPNDVLAPVGTEVVGAVKSSSKWFDWRTTDADAAN